MMVTPHLKTVLKDYQHSAVKSLHGPAHHLHPPFAPPPPSPLSGAAAASIATTAAGGSYEESACSPAAAATVAAAYIPPLPVQQLPILTTSDTSSSDLSFTPLEDVSISCFSVGGEKRLCLPQVLQSVLGDFTLAQINHQCDNLLIYCSRCTPEQLNVLKSQGILPSSAFSCGLITKSDAERLCSALLYAPPPPRGKPAARVKKELATAPPYAENNVEAHTHIAKAAAAVAIVKTEDGDKERPLLSGARARPRAGGGRVFRVRHECFGRAVGVLHEALYVAKQAKCIECTECKGWHSPQQFVKHVHWQHARGESQTVHWGFDSAKWRHYLLPLLADASDAAVAEECCAHPLADDAEADRVLDLMRDRYEGVAPFAAYDGDKPEIKKEWNMSLKHKLLHQVNKSLTPPPRPPPTPSTIKRDTSSPLFTTKKTKLSGEEYTMLVAPAYLQPIEPYLQSAVFQQFTLPFPYAALPLGVGHPSAKEAKLRQTIVESNADLVRPAAHVVDDSSLPPTPKKQRLFRHMQEQRRKLEEVQKSPDSTTVPTTPSAPVERKYSEIDLSTTDTEDTASEGTASAHSDPPKPASATAETPLPLDGIAEMARLQALFAIHPHPEKHLITDMFRRLLDECALKGERIRELETQRRRRPGSPASDCGAEVADGDDESPPSVAPDASTGAEDQQVQIDYKSVITRGDGIVTDADGATTTSSFGNDDSKPHCPSAACAPVAT